MQNQDLFFEDGQQGLGGLDLWRVNEIFSGLGAGRILVVGEALRARVDQTHHRLQVADAVLAPGEGVVEVFLAQLESEVSWLE